MGPWRNCEQFSRMLAQGLRQVNEWFLTKGRHAGDSQLILLPIWSKKHNKIAREQLGLTRRAQYIAGGLHIKQQTLGVTTICAVSLINSFEFGVMPRITVRRRSEWVEDGEQAKD